MWLLLSLLLWSALPASPENSTRDLVAGFEEHYRAAKTLQATFLQRYTENGHLVRSEAGIAYFRRPGKMRWEYESPEKDIFLVDGKTAWFYVPADHTVTRVPAKQSTDWRTPLALLAGEMKVSRVCARVGLVTTEKTENESYALLSCSLRGTESKSSSTVNQSRTTSDAQADIVLFEIVRTTGELVRLLVRQRAGVEVEFRFENWLISPRLPEALFRFDPPPGVAIVNGELPDPNAGVR